MDKCPGSNPQNDSRWSTFEDMDVYKVIYSGMDETPGVRDNSLKRMVGASGFEPPTSWSRTNQFNPITLCLGVAYGLRSVISPLLVVPNLYLTTRVKSAELSRRGELEFQRSGLMRNFRLAAMMSGATHTPSSQPRTQLSK